jgi:hypothetical protein
LSALQPFHSVGVSPGASPVEDEWGAFSSESAVVGGEFGTFDHVPLESTNHDVKNSIDDVENVTARKLSFSVRGSPAASSVEDEWGAFTSNSAVGGGEFATFPAVVGGKFASFDTSDDDDDDWGDFDNMKVPHTPDSLQIRIRDLSSPLARNLLRRSGTSGEHVDLVECYEVNIESNTLLDATKAKVMSDRCIQILELLTKMDHTSGCTYWNQVLEVVRDEVNTGMDVLRDTKRLSTSDMKAIIPPLSTMIAGLRECVRVARLIVASIGDLLMLDLEALLTPDTMKSTWCGMAILEVALEIETGWKSVRDSGRSFLPSIGALDDAPTVTEIRSAVFAYHGSTGLCQLTLQPLLQEPNLSTQSRVAWGKKEFMACSANLLANLCPFFSLAA